jgi:hypothetical protein
MYGGETIVPEKSPITVQWDGDQKKIVRWCIPEGFSWDDFDCAIDACVALTNTVSHPVDMLIVADTPFPLDLVGIRHFMELLTAPFTHRNGRVLALINGGDAAMIMIKYAQDTYPDSQRTFHRLQFFTTEQQAQAFFDGEDETES